MPFGMRVVVKYIQISAKTCGTCTVAMCNLWQLVSHNKQHPPHHHCHPQGRDAGFYITFKADFSRSNQRKESNGECLMLHSKDIFLAVSGDEEHHRNKLARLTFLVVYFFSIYEKDFPVQSHMKGTEEKKCRRKKCLCQNRFPSVNSTLILSFFGHSYNSVSLWSFFIMEDPTTAYI